MVREFQYFSSLHNLTYSYFLLLWRESLITELILACPWKPGASQWLRRPCRPSCAEQGGGRTGCQTSQLALAGEERHQEALQGKTALSPSESARQDSLRRSESVVFAVCENKNALFPGIASVRQQWALEARLRRHSHLLRLGPHCCTLHQVGLGWGGRLPVCLSVKWREFILNDRQSC